MSFPALAAVSKMRLGSAAEKLIALAYADRHNEETGCAYPSLAWLCEFSSLNRKTVIATVGRLEARGLLTDTGRREGKTGQIKVYQLSFERPGLRGENHYVYRITDTLTGEFYIGVRSFLGDPTSDRYMGSGKWPTGATFRGDELRKEILATFENRTAAENAEAEAIREAMQHPLCKNIAKEFQKRHRSQTDPKSGRLKSPVFSRKESQKRDTDTVKEPIGSEAKASSPRRAAYPPPPGVPNGVWSDYLKLRDRKRAPMSDTAYRRQLSKLEELAEHGFPPGEVVALSVERGWTGFFQPRNTNDDRTDPTLSALAKFHAQLGSGGAVG